jgi:hypothetical protein
MRYVDITGRVFGKLTAIRVHESSSKKNEKWLFDCACGKQTVTLKRHAMSGAVVSCNCAKKKHGHGGDGERSPTYFSWCGMKQRCTDKSHTAFEHYGGRGIGFEPRWESFENFLADMGERPEGTSLDRINNEEGYSKENCRWVSQRYQTQNRRKKVNAVSIYTGVARSGENWTAQIRKEVHYHLGTFKSEIDAARAYNKKALELYGPNARLNIIAPSQGEEV